MLVVFVYSNNITIKIFCKILNAPPMLEKNPLAKKLLYKSKNRGCRETSLLLGAFAERHLDGMPIEQQKKFAEILEQTDADIYDWLTGKSLAPAELDRGVMQQLLKFNINKK